MTASEKSCSNFNIAVESGNSTCSPYVKSHFSPVRRLTVSSKEPEEGFGGELQLRRLGSDVSENTYSRGLEIKARSHNRIIGSNLLGEHGRISRWRPGARYRRSKRASLLLFGNGTVLAYGPSDGLLANVVITAI